MRRPKKKNAAAQRLAQQRWKKATKKEREEQGKVLAEGRRKARLRRRGRLT